MEFYLWQIAIAIVCLGIILFLIRKIFNWLRRFSQQRRFFIPLEKKEIKKKWQEIEEILKKENEASWRLAILEADKFFDYLLKSIGFSGDSFGQRLKLACYKFEKLRPIWFAHKIRNRIVHDSGYKPSFFEAKRALKIFKEGIKELGLF